MKLCPYCKIRPLCGYKKNKNIEWKYAKTCGADECKEKNRKANYKKNREKYISRAKKNNKKPKYRKKQAEYRKKNREKKIIVNRKYREKNAEKIKNYLSNYHRCPKNRDRINLRRAQRYKTDPDYRKKQNMDSRKKHRKAVHILIKAQGYFCLFCGNKLPKNLTLCHVDHIFPKRLARKEGWTKEKIDDIVFASFMQKM